MRNENLWADRLTKQDTEAWEWHRISLKMVRPDSSEEKLARHKLFSFTVSTKQTLPFHNDIKACTARNNKQEAYLEIAKNMGTKQAHVIKQREMDKNSI